MYATGSTGSPGFKIEGVSLKYSGQADVANESGVATVDGWGFIGAPVAIFVDGKSIHVVR